jgi:hypothetical protein
VIINLKPAHRKIMNCSNRVALGEEESIYLKLNVNGKIDDEIENIQKMNINKKKTMV